jgi:hypothetical protein
VTTGAGEKTPFVGHTVQQLDLRDVLPAIRNSRVRLARDHERWLQIDRRQALEGYDRPRTSSALCISTEEPPDRYNL